MKRFLAFVLTLAMLTGITASADTSKPQNDSHSSATWNILWINIDTIKFNGITAQMYDSDYEASLMISKRFEDFIEKSTNNALNINIVYKTITEPVTSMSPVYNGYWVSPTDIDRYINDYWSERPYDAIMVIARMDGISRGYWGLAQGPSIIKDSQSGYSFVPFLDGESKYYLEETPENPHPEEPYVHEWVHQVEFFYNLNGLNVPGADDSKKYGYECLSGCGYNGFFQYYNDILSSCVLYDDQYIGVPAEAWSYKPSQTNEISSDRFANYIYRFRSIDALTVSEIQQEAFMGCDALTGVQFLEGNKISIGENAFGNCQQLTRVILPSDTSAIADSAFDGCPSIVIYTSSEYVIHYSKNNNIKFETAR